MIVFGHSRTVDSYFDRLPRRLSGNLFNVTYITVDYRFSLISALSPDFARDFKAFYYVVVPLVLVGVLFVLNVFTP